jgi:hypothetical protein
MGELRERVAAAANQRAGREAQRAKSEKWPKYTAWATVAAVIVALGAGIVSIWGLRQQQQAAASQDQDSRYSSISQLEIDVDKTIADHPRLISCFLDVQCNAEPALTTQEMLQATILAAYVVDFYQYLFDQLENLGYLPPSGEFLLRKNATEADIRKYEPWITWSETIVGGFESSSLECDVLTNNANAYEQLFVHDVAMTDACPKLSDPRALSR